MTSRVAILKTMPETVLNDYGRLLHLANYEEYLLKANHTALKINISWHHFYPACSTTPWQLEGVIKALLADGYKKELIHACHNRTVVVSAKKGEIANKHKPIIERYGLRNIHLYEGEEWVIYEPKGKMLVLPEIFPEGIKIPKRHWTHSVIHETLVDLLTIQKEIHSGIFAVMDGTFAGDGPGPRCMVPHVKNYILASGDPVAIDAVAAKIMGFDPMSIKFIRLAHEAGLGCGDLMEIEIVGEDVSDVNFGFRANENTFASQGQKLIYWGALKPLEKLLLRTIITPWSYLASRAYHDWYWYPFIGKRRVRKAMKTGWGRLFEGYG